MRPELKRTREFVERVNHDPSHFPPAMPPSINSGEGGPNSGNPTLTDGFAQKLYDGTVCDHHDVGGEFPIVVVTAIDCRHKDISLGNQSNQEKRCTLHVADGDDNIVTVKVATQLNSRMGAVRVG